VRISLLKEHEENWRSFCVLAVLLLIAGTATIMHPGNLASVFRHWFEFIGEITASGYVVLGAVVAALGRGRLQSALGAGVLFGLAAQTKSLAVLQILVIAPLLVWHFAASLRSLKPTAMASAALAFGYAIPNVTVALWISASLSPTDYAEQLDATARLFGEAGSGLTQLRQADDPVAYIIGNIAAHAKAFATVFSPLDSVLALVLIGVCLTVVFGEARASRLGRARPFDPWLVAGGENQRASHMVVSARVRPLDSPADTSSDDFGDCCGVGLDDCAGAKAAAHRAGMCDWVSRADALACRRSFCEIARARSAIRRRHRVEPDFGRKAEGRV
jgi:hypothetical protein